MSDIKERLRKAHLYDHYIHVDTASTMKEAADYIEQLEKDAARYEWLRKQPLDSGHGICVMKEWRDGWGNTRHNYLRVSHLDRAIDTALYQQSTARVKQELTDEKIKEIAAPIIDIRGGSRMDSSDELIEYTVQVVRAALNQRLAVKEACPTCGGSKVDPGGLPICRTCGLLSSDDQQAKDAALSSAGMRVSSLLSRIRPDVEAAPWVIGELKDLAVALSTTKQEG